MSTLGNIWRWLRLQFGGHRDLELVVFKHVQAEPATLLSFQIGPCCIYCYAHPRDEAWKRPCPRMRPNMTELA